MLTGPNRERPFSRMFAFSELNRGSWSHLICSSYFNKYRNFILSLDKDFKAFWGNKNPYHLSERPWTFLCDLRSEQAFFEVTLSDSLYQVLHSSLQQTLQGSIESPVFGLNSLDTMDAKHLFSVLEMRTMGLRRFYDRFLVLFDWIDFLCWRDWFSVRFWAIVSLHGFVLRHFLHMVLWKWD